MTPVDADEDGRWDVLFVHANGWAKPGDFHATGTFPLPPLLLLNTGTSGGNPVFVDASALYLPEALAIHGKGAAAADFDGDGHEDLVLAVGRLGFVFDEGDDSIRSKNIDGMDLLHLPTTTHGLPPG